MSLPTDKVKRMGDTVIMYCPACRTLHAIDARHWEFDGNMDSPTFQSRDSIVYGERFASDGKGPDCHFFVREGLIYFWNDIRRPEHGYRDTIVRMVPVSDWFKEFTPVVVGRDAQNHYATNYRYAPRPRYPYP